MSNLPLYYEALDMYEDTLVECCVCGKERELRHTYDVWDRGSDKNYIEQTWRVACTEHFPPAGGFACNVQWKVLRLPFLQEEKQKGDQQWTGKQMDGNAWKRSLASRLQKCKQTVN